MWSVGVQGGLGALSEKEERKCVLILWSCAISGSLVLPSFTTAFTKTIMPVSYVVYLSKQEGDRKDLCETRL